MGDWRLRGCDKPAEDGKLCPPVAQFAERQGTQVALNIIRRLKGEETKPFSFKMMGAMCSIGGRNAIAEVMGLQSERSAGLVRMARRVFVEIAFPLSANKSRHGVDV